MMVVSEVRELSDPYEMPYVVKVRFDNGCGVSIAAVDGRPDGPVSVFGLVFTSVDGPGVVVYGGGVLSGADRYGELRVFPDGLGEVLAEVAGLPVFTPGEGFAVG